MKSFYKKYPNIYEQLKDERKTTYDWLNVVSDFDDDDKKIYADEGDIIPNKKNIEKILILLLNSNKTEIQDILNDIKHFKTEVLDDDDDSFNILIENIILHLSKNHAYIKIKNPKNQKICWDVVDDDCSLLYINIFKHIDPCNDYNTELSNILNNLISIELEKSEINIKPCIKRFLLSIKIFKPENKNKFCLEIPTFFDNIEEIDVSIPEFTQEKIPDTFKKLKKLKKLRIFGKLKKLPDLCDCSKLEELKLTSTLIISIPDCFAKLENLKNLHLVNNRPMFDNVDNLNKFLKTPNLHILELINNGIKDLPESFVDNLTNLKELNLLNNRLYTLPTSFSKLSNSLEILGLSTNPLRDLPDLSHFSKLKTLDISYTRYTGRLPEYITNLLNLEELNCSNMSLESLPDLTKLTKLKNINLISNSFKTYPETLINMKLKEVNITFIEDDFDFDKIEFKFAPKIRKDQQNYILTWEDNE